MPNKGIAVGMASDICSFNLAEVCDGTIALLKNPNLTVEKIMDIIKAPDLPGGGTIIYNDESMRRIYETGSGSFKIRAQYRYDKKNNCIDILEIPESTTIELIIKKLDDLAKAGKLKEQKLKALEEEKDSFLADRRAEMAAKREWQEMSIRELTASRDAELKGAGVDVSALKDCENQIKSLSDELDFIDANRDKTVEYRKDKRELFDREDEFRQLRRALEDRRAALAERHQIRLRQLNDKHSAEKSSLEAVQKVIRESESGFVKLEEFRTSGLFPAYLHGLEEQTSSSGALPLIEELKNTITESMSVKDQFKRSVNIFKAPFGSGNIFRFKTNLVLDEDYMEYAANLEEFVEQNKIEEYRGRTSDRYLEILQRVSREMGDMGGFASQVEKIIREINSDFREKQRMIMEIHFHLGKDPFEG